MAKVKDVYGALAAFAPPALKMDFDNVGFLVGFSENDVSKILVTLDITDEVVREAVRENAQLIVSHHPLFFSLKSVTDADRTGRKLTALLTHGISAVCMHTTLDAAKGGVNDALAAAAGLTRTALLSEDVLDEAGLACSYGRVGYLPAPVKLADYLKTLKAALGTGGLRYHDAGRDACKVAVVGGFGGGELKHAAEHGCDTFLTARHQIRRLFRGQGAGHQPHRRRPLLHGKRRDARSGRFPARKISGDFGRPVIGARPDGKIFHIKTVAISPVTL
jgi:dinuclear metal center YbgI/SA1388 family protein